MSRQNLQERRAQEHRHMQKPALSRSGRTSPVGKLTYTIAGFKVAEETGEGLERLAAEAGVGVTEFVRMLCDIRVLGADHVLSLEAQRIAVVAGKSQKVNGK